MQNFPKRKAFNFYKSYYDVFFMLPENERLKYITAILKKQFENVDPVDLEGMAKLAYTSQEHSIISQVDGFLNKINTPTVGGRQGGRQGGYVGGRQGGCQAPSVQEKEKEKEKEEEKGKGKFAPPSLDELINHMASKLDDFTAQSQANLFLSHYTSNGWKVGKNSMKDWKAAANGWITRMSQYKIEQKEIPIRPQREQDKWF